MKKIHLYLLLVLALTFFCISCEENDTATTDKGDISSEEYIAEGYWKDSDTNTLINTSSDGYYAARQGDTHYYVDGAFIVREDMSGVNETQKWEQNGGNIVELVPVGDKVFFLQEHGSGRNERLNYIDLKKQEIFEVEDKAIHTIAPYSCLSLHGEWLYFVREGDYPQEHIHRLNVNTLKSEIIYSTEKSIEIYLSKDKIFYYHYAKREDGERVIQIRTMTLDGKDDKMILEYIADGYDEGYMSPIFFTGDNGVEIYTRANNGRAYSLYKEADGTCETIYLYTYNLTATNNRTLSKPYPYAVFAIDSSIYQVVPDGTSYKTEFITDGKVTDIDYIEAIGDIIYFNTTIKTDMGSRKLYYRVIDGEVQRLTAEETISSWGTSETYY